MRNGDLRGEPELVGMISGNEQEFYPECARRLRGVPGAIVDLGCWMGSTAISLARGLAAAGETTAAGERIYAIDRFIWEPWMSQHLAKVSGRYVPGDSFLPEARGRMQPYLGLIEVVEADLTTYAWQGGPIKLLLVDVMKDWELARTVARSFFGFLTDGSILIHQDFKHYYTPWIHLLQYRLRDHFRLMRSLPYAGTVAFETRAPMAAAAVDHATDFDSVSDAEVESAFQYSLDVVGEAARERVEAAHIMYFIHRKRKSKAEEIYRRYSTHEDGLDHDLRKARESLDRMASEAAQSDELAPDEKPV
jgi:hypothetical protein